MQEPASKKLSAPEPSNACLKKSTRMARLHAQPTAHAQQSFKQWRADTLVACAMVREPRD